MIYRIGDSIKIKNENDVVWKKYAYHTLSNLKEYFGKNYIIENIEFFHSNNLAEISLKGCPYITWFDDEIIFDLKENRKIKMKKLTKIK